jgi:hypothetical protein
MKVLFIILMIVSLFCSCWLLHRNQEGISKNPIAIGVLSYFLMLTAIAFANLGFGG